jgi:hypothetical protein
MACWWGVLRGLPNTWREARWATKSHNWSVIIVMDSMGSTQGLDSIYDELVALCKGISDQMHPERYQSQIKLLVFLCSDSFQALLIAGDRQSIDNAIRLSGLSLSCEVLEYAWRSLTLDTFTNLLGLQSKKQKDSYVGPKGQDLYWLNALLTSAQACQDLYELDSAGLLRFWELHSYCRLGRWIDCDTTAPMTALKMEAKALQSIIEAPELFLNNRFVTLTLVSSKYLEAARLWLLCMQLNNSCPDLIIIAALDQDAYNALPNLINRTVKKSIIIRVIKYYYDFAAQPLYGSLENPIMDSFWCHKTAIVLAASSFCEVLAVSDIDAFWLNGLRSFTIDSISHCDFLAQPERGIPFPLSRALGTVACQGFYLINCLSMPRLVLRLFLRLTGIFGDDQTAFNTLMHFSRKCADVQTFGIPVNMTLRLMPESVSPRGGLISSAASVYHPQIINPGNLSIVANELNRYFQIQQEH